MADSLTYNAVEMAIICEKEIGRRHIYTDDQTTYMWTEWVFDVRSQLNPATISWLANAIALGQVPANTDKIIRQMLAQPRKPLIFTQNGIEVLRVPRQANIATDVHLGPFVEHVDVTRDIAGHTWIIEIRIVARVRECPRQPGPILISNRWTRTMDTDEDYLSFVTTQGECVFDSSTLIRDGQFVDQFRVSLMHPIAANCKRDNIVVTPMSDGCTLRYSFRDQERHFNNSFATRIEAYQTEGYSQQSFLDSLVGSGLSALPNIISAAANRDIGGAVGQGASAGFQALQQQIPRYFSSIIVRAWGHRNQNKVNLLRMALGMAFERVPNRRSVEFLVSRDLNGKMVEVQLTSRTGAGELAIQFTNNIVIPAIIQPAIQIGQNLLAMAGALGNQINGGVVAGAFPPLANPAGLSALPDGVMRPILNITTQENSFGGQGPFAEAASTPWYTQANVSNLRPPNSSGTRGTLLQKIVAQELHNPCELPPFPTTQTFATFPDQLAR